MDTDNPYVLTVNAGSSSIKLAVFALGDISKKVLEATVENIGQPTASLVTHGESEPGDNGTQPVTAADLGAAAQILTDWLSQRIPKITVAAIGHRIVHGGPNYYESQIIDDALLAGLRNLTLFDAEHLPVEIQLVETFQKLFPSAPQVACFDTAFHHDLPSVARLLPIPRHLEANGIRRYGFHGLSYAFVLNELRSIAGESAADGRLIVAHLGNGVSLAAVHHGKSIDTTMGLTPASGVPMSTRSGDLDPGLGLYLARSQHFDADQFNDMVNFKSGLLGISETTSDMKQLLELQAHDDRAKEAVALFCYQVKKSIGSLAAALGGIDTLVFTGGMGENSPEIRARICDGLEFLGLAVEPSYNKAGADIISPEGSKVTVRVIRTDEASTIAKEVQQLLSSRKVATHAKQ